MGILTAETRNSPAAEHPALSFAGLLRRLRLAVRLTQEELAEAAGLSPRSISDLERGVNLTARKTTALLLADALSLADPVRALFVAAARGRASASEALAAWERSSAPITPSPRLALGLSAGALADDARVLRGDAEAVPNDAEMLAHDIADRLGDGPERSRLIAAVTAVGVDVGLGVLRIYLIGIDEADRPDRAPDGDREHAPDAPRRRGDQ